MTNQEIVEKVNTFLIDRLEMETELVKPGPTGAHRLASLAVSHGLAAPSQ